tara:strand:+ start:3071 stop:3571 length:501 start_codon:yes stop_codon:yes gene_type:complete
MSELSYRNNKKIVRYGKYETEYTGPGKPEIKVLHSINKETFYRTFISLNNVIGVRRSGVKIIETKLSPAPTELLIHILNKDDDFTMAFRNKDAVMKKLGEELGKTPSSVYANIGKLRDAGYLIKDEDSLFVLNNELRDIRKLVIQAIENKKPLTFDFIFKFCMVDG